MVYVWPIVGHGIRMAYSRPWYTYGLYVYTYGLSHGIRMAYSRPWYTYGL